jgi:hypothetical protein
MKGGDTMTEHNPEWEGLGIEQGEGEAEQHEEPHPGIEEHVEFNDDDGEEVV